VHDPFAVAVRKADNVVGHIPRLFSAACYVFLGRPGSRILCTVTEHRKYSRDLPQGGMEIPCQYTFHGGKSMITKLKVLLSENNNQLSATSEPQAKTSNSSEAFQKDCSPVLPVSPTTTSTSTCSPTCSKHHSPMEHPSKTEASDNSHQCTSLKETKQLKLDGDNETSGQQMWVKFGRIQLFKLDCKEIESGNWLTDKPINYAQALIKSQFQVQGLQSTLLQKSVHSISSTDNMLQIVHCHGNHWIVVSTIFSPSGVILVYDSLYDSIDSETTQIILNLFANNHLKLEMVNVHKQVGSNDCGLFSIANAVQLAKKNDPAKIKYIQCAMRPHLIKCFSQGRINSFPLQKL